MDLLILEVDGSLSNPFAAAAVGLWALVLSSGAAIVAYRKCSPLVRTGAILLWVAAAAATRVAQQSIGSLLYSLDSWSVVSVGFWDGPPVWPAPVVAGVVGAAFWVRQRRSNGADAARRMPATPGG